MIMIIKLKITCCFFFMSSMLDIELAELGRVLGNDSDSDDDREDLWVLWVLWCCWWWSSSWRWFLFLFWELMFVIEMSSAHWALSIELIEHNLMPIICSASWISFPLRWLDCNLADPIHIQSWIPWKTFKKKIIELEKIYDEDASLSHLAEVGRGVFGLRASSRTTCEQDLGFY